MIVVTGAAGFIGYHVAWRLLDRGETVVGIDNFDPYYDPALKAARSAMLERRSGFTLHRLDIGDTEALAYLFERTAPRHVVHLAAQAGVRHSLTAPLAYERANVAGHLSVLECCRGQRGIEHFVYASSSSVYGERAIDRPFREDDPLDDPTSLYAATKRSAELMSATYARLFGLPQSGLRFFTAYGPWGRPDMAYFAFTRRILAGEPIEVFGHGQMVRDFTYISDIVDGLLAVLDRPPREGDHRLFNIGSSRPVAILQVIEALEAAIGQPAQKVFLPRQPGEVNATYADISAINALTGYQPRVHLEEGLRRFVDWYREYHTSA
jgi:UDP-glucuronate 4-epimerase